MGFNTEGPIPCRRCEGSRYDPEPLKTCPYDLLTKDIRDALDMAAHAQKGRWPVAGGLLDQAAIFVEACEEIWGQQRQYEASRFAGSIEE